MEQSSAFFFSFPFLILGYEPMRDTGLGWEIDWLLDGKGVGVILFVEELAGLVLTAEYIAW